MAATSPRRLPAPAAVAAAAALLLASLAAGDDHNGVYDPCADTTVRRGDGFTLGVAFAGRDAFFSGGVQLSPCDSRLGLANNRAQVALFRPQVDEISLLTVNSSFDPVSSSPPPCYPPNPSKISRPISKNLPALGICFFLIAWYMKL